MNSVLGYNSDNFRVCLEINNVKQNVVTKYYILVNLNSFKTVKNLEEHIKNTFNITENIELLIDDCILPSNELIFIIRPGDILRLNLGSKNELLCKRPVITVDEKNVVKEVTDPGVGAKLNGECKTLKKKKKCFDSSLGPLVQFLRQENESLNLAERIATNSAETAKTGSSMDEEIDASKASFDDSSSMEHSGKGKRKRRHKHKSKNKESIKTKDPPEIVTSQPYLSTPNNSLHKSGKHLYFDDVEGVIEEESVDVKLEAEEDWKSNLLALANAPSEKKIFHRQTESKSISDIDLDNLNPLHYPIVKTLCKNDLVMFTILKIGSDYCPTQSEKIVARVLNVDEATENIQLEILRGSEEFVCPDGKFTIDDFNYNKSSNKIIELTLPEMLELRLLFP